MRPRSGTCRDFAWLMVEALRRLGYAARFVTGYLYSPAHSAMRGAGATHAWCEVFLPATRLDGIRSHQRAWSRAPT